jgi:hypothetical protein
MNDKKPEVSWREFLAPYVRGVFQEHPGATITEYRALFRKLWQDHRDYWDHKALRDEIACQAEERGLSVITHRGAGSRPGSQRSQRWQKRLSEIHRPSRPARGRTVPPAADPEDEEEQITLWT